MKKTKTFRLMLVAGALVASPFVAAAPCAGFTDLDSSNGLCPNVEWLKNRAVTLGCDVGVFCPTGSVTRLQMAAFMNRLGTALTPFELLVEGSGAIDLDANPVVCQTTPFTAANYPRHASADLAFAGRATAGVDVGADVVVSLNNGSTWTVLNAIASRGTVPANEWASMAKWNETLRIEEALGGDARFAGRDALAIRWPPKR